MVLLLSLPVVIFWLLNDTELFWRILAGVLAILIASAAKAAVEFGWTRYKVAVLRFSSGGLNVLRRAALFGASTLTYAVLSVPRLAADLITSTIRARLAVLGTSYKAWISGYCMSALSGPKHVALGGKNLRIGLVGSVVVSTIGALLHALDLDPLTMMYFGVPLFGVLLMLLTNAWCDGRYCLAREDFLRVGPSDSGRCDNSRFCAIVDAPYGRCQRYSGIVGFAPFGSRALLHVRTPKHRGRPQRSARRIFGWSGFDRVGTGSGHCHLRDLTAVETIPAFYRACHFGY